ncbi:DUF397 domain-containing protein [Actinomadura kijaniata]
MLWRKSSHSNDSGANCVEVAASPNTVAIRDSKNPDGGVVALNRMEACALSALIKSI